MPAFAIYYLPMVVFALWSLYGAWKFRGWRSLRYVVRPENGLWTLWRILNNSEWTPEGLKLRAAYLRHIAIGVIFAAAVAFAIAAS